MARDVALITWKRAEDGNGSILRLQETSGTPADADIHFLKAGIKSAKLCSGVEANLKDLPVQGNAIHVSLKPFEVITVRVIGVS